MSKLRSIFGAAAAIAAAAALGNAALAQSVTPPPVPGMMPPIASHSDPTLAVPTTPPERMAGPAPAQARAEFRRLESHVWSRFVPVAERRGAGLAGWASAAD